jgi:hypothetical protein
MTKIIVESDSDSSVFSLINSEAEKEIVGDKRAKRPKSEQQSD